MKIFRLFIATLVVVFTLIIFDDVAMAKFSSETLTRSITTSTIIITPAQKSVLEECKNVYGHYADCLAEAILERDWDHNLCGVISSYTTQEGPNECYDVLLRKTKKNIKCVDYQDENNRAHCLLNTCKNEECCTQMPSKPKFYGNSYNSCLGRVAEITNDFDLCLKSKDFSCFIRMAEKQNKPIPTSVCDTFSLESNNVVPSRSYKVECMLELAKVNQNAETCLALKQNSYDYKECIINSSQEKYCATFNKNDDQEYCYKSISRDRGDYSLCNLIKTDSKKRECRSEAYIYNTNGYHTNFTEILIQLAFLVILVILYYYIKSKNKESYLIPVLNVSIGIVFLYRIVVDFIYLVLPKIWQGAQYYLDLLIFFRTTDMFLSNFGFTFSSILPYKWIYLLMNSIFTTIIFLLIAILLKNLSHKKIAIMLLILWLMPNILTAGLLFLMLASIG